MNHQKEYEARTFRDYNRKLEEMDDERDEEGMQEAGDKIGHIIEDIKGIVEVLDPEGYKWAEEMKKEREDVERNRHIHPLMRGIVNNMGRGL